MRAWALLLALLLAPALAAADGVPRAAKHYQRTLTKVIVQEWGAGGSAARAAAQIHQESAWREGARSWAGAEGWAQFMPATARWIAEIYPDLGPAQPYSVAWAFRAMARYDGHLFARTLGHTHCDRWWATLRAYNGGLGHLRAEARQADDPFDRDSVAAACGSARRSAVHCPENTGYPERILQRWEPVYLAAGWRGRPTCAG